MGEAGMVYPPVGAAEGYMGEAGMVYAPVGAAGAGGNPINEAGGTWLKGCIGCIGLLTLLSWKAFAASAGGSPLNEGSRVLALPQMCW